MSFTSFWVKGNAWMILALVFTLLFSGVVAAPLEKGGAQVLSASLMPNVYFSPDPIEIGVGAIRDVNLMVENVEGLYALEIRISFPNSLAQVVDADPGVPGVQIRDGDIFSGFHSYTIQNSADNTNGQIEYIHTITGSDHGKDGGGIIATISLQGVAQGQGVMAFVEVVLCERDGTSISATYRDSRVNITVQGSTPTPTPTLPPGVTPTSTYTPSPGPSPTTHTPTAAPTPTGTLPTPTRTSAPTDTPTGVLVTPTPVCADRIVNGGFESLSGDEAPPWVRGGGTSYTSLEHRTGTSSAWLGGYNNAADTLYQQVTIPSHTAPEEVTQVTLGFWWGMITQETTHPFDFMQVCIRDAGGALLETLMTIDDGAVSGSWQEASFDLSAYKGQTIRICFEATTNGEFPTSFFIDDVSLVICEILQPTPTHTPSPSPTISPTPSITGLPTNTPTITPTPIIVVLQYKEGEYEGCVDSFLDAWQPTTNYGHGGALSIRTTGVKRPLIYFDVSRIPTGVTIVDARLWLYTSHYKSHSTSMTVSVYGLKRSWVEMETTWQRASSGENWGAPGADDTLTDRDEAPSDSRLVSATNTWYDFDVTSLVQAWVDGRRANNGVLLIATGNTLEMSFWSSEYSLANLRPKLVIQYVWGTLVPTNTPGPTVTGPAPTATVTPTATRAGNEMIFQQGYLGYSGVTDTHISAWDPTSNFGGNLSLLVRQGDVRSALLRFDLSALPAGVTIQEAKLGLYALDRSNPNALTISVYQVLRSWVENQATWNLAASSVPWGAPGCNLVGVDRAEAAVASRVVNAVGTWHEWDVTSLVRTWAANPSSNRGVILKGDGSTSVEYSFASSEYWWGYSYSPKLVVRYTTP